MQLDTYFVVPRLGERSKLREQVAIAKLGVRIEVRKWRRLLVRWNE